MNKREYSKVIVVRTEGGKQVADETHEDGQVVCDDLRDVEVTKRSHEYLVFRTARIGAPQSTRHNEHRLDGSQTPIVVVLVYIEQELLRIT